MNKKERNLHTYESRVVVTVVGFRIGENLLLHHHSLLVSVVVVILAAFLVRLHSRKMEFFRTIGGTTMNKLQTLILQRINNRCRCLAEQKIPLWANPPAQIDVGWAQLEREGGCLFFWIWHLGLPRGLIFIPILAFFTQQNNNNKIK